MNQENNLNFDIQNLNYFIIFISSILTGSTIHNYKIYKDFNKQTEIKILTPEKTKSIFEKEDKKRILSQNLGKDILKFKKVLEENINNEEFNFLFKNLKTLKTKEKIFFLKYLLLHFTGGNYNPKKNKINVLNFIKDEVINHELFHMATSVYDNKKDFAFCGFMQINYKTRDYIGSGLNEGYTQLLTERYFGETNEIAVSYKICMFFSKKLEEIIGKDKMQSLYLNANLTELINELKKYDTEENIIKFIKSLDTILKYINYMYSPLKKLSIYKYYINEKNTQLLEFIQFKLMEWYIKKKEIELDNKLINKQQLKKDIDEYYFSLKYNKTLLNKDIETINYKKIKKLYNKKEYSLK